MMKIDETRCRLMYLVPPTAFYPQPEPYFYIVKFTLRPKVMSAVVELDFEDPEVDVDILLEVVKESFRQWETEILHDFI